VVLLVDALEKRLPARVRPVADSRQSHWRHPPDSRHRAVRVQSAKSPRDTRHQQELTGAYRLRKGWSESISIRSRHVKRVPAQFYLYYDI
jgi:hypothetical protein